MCKQPGMTSRSTVTDDTRRHLLDCAWHLVLEGGDPGFSLSELAARAGVSRQTVYLAFGARAGLLQAMLRNHDRHAPEVAAMTRAATATPSLDTLLEFADAWIAYLPRIYPVAIHLDAAALADAAAAEAWDDRMKHANRAGLRRIFAGLKPSAGLTPQEAADSAWALLHPVTWRLLVVESGWSADRFRQTRLDALRALVNSA